MIYSGWLLELHIKNLGQLMIRLRLFLRILLQMLFFSCRLYFHGIF